MYAFMQTFKTALVRISVDETRQPTCQIPTKECAKIHCETWHWLITETAIFHTFYSPATPTNATHSCTHGWLAPVVRVVCFSSMGALHYQHTHLKMVESMTTGTNKITHI